jgi:maltose alpha-D-glucosyltransferase/alpha-amylase
VIDFEGEPRRPLEERRAKTSPLRDVAGMLRSLDYAAWSAWQYRLEFAPDPAAISSRVEAWRAFATDAFRAAYEETIAGSPVHPEDPELAKAMLDLFLVQKAVYEVGYELASRPDWVTIPLRGLLAISEE